VSVRTSVWGNFMDQLEIYMALGVIAALAVLSLLAPDWLLPF